MPKNVRGTDPVIDPVAAWEAGLPLVSPAEAHARTAGPRGVPDPLSPQWPFAEATDLPDLQPLLCNAGHANLPGAKFCTECGDRLALPEPDGPWTDGLGHTSPASARFCSECGAQRPDTVAPVAGAGFAAEFAARASTATAESFRPKPWDELTEAEKTERMRQHTEAVRLGAAMPDERLLPPAEGAETVLIHVCEDGLTAFGRVWYRGQEIELPVGSPRYEQARSWIHATPSQQMERYNGRVMFRPGPWPGARTYTAGGPQAAAPLMSMDGQHRLSGPSIEELQRADQLEQQRARRVPAPVL
jgi:hypothetical protein